jgi:hypothetical protein
LELHILDLTIMLSTKDDGIETGVDYLKKSERSKGEDGILDEVRSNAALAASHGNSGLGRKICRQLVGADPCEWIITSHAATPSCEIG